MKTIAAISTAPAVGGIGVIRISGEEALKIGEKVFSPQDKKKSISSVKGYTAAFGHIVKDGETIDECIATVFRAPHSYTGDIMGDLNKKRGRVLGMNPIAGGKTEIVADIPLSELYGYSTNLRSMTGGRGTYAYSFSRYEQAPSDVQAKVIADNEKSE